MVTNGKQDFEAFAKIIMGLHIYPPRERDCLSQKEHGVILQVEKLEPTPYKEDFCWYNCERHVIDNGGNVIYGWGLFIDNDGYHVAQHHAVWLSHEGNYLDVTPDKSISKSIYFLPDNRVPNHYEDKVGSALLLWEPDPSCKPIWVIKNPMYMKRFFEWIPRTPTKDEHEHVCYLLGLEE